MKGIPAEYCVQFNADDESAIGTGEKLELAQSSVLPEFIACAIDVTTESCPLHQALMTGGGRAT